MRSELVELEEVGVYNEWVGKLRKKVLGGELGGDRKELWREVGRNRVGLVERREGGMGDVVGGGVEEEARKVSFFYFDYFPFSFPFSFFPLFFFPFFLSSIPLPLPLSPFPSLFFSFLYLLPLVKYPTRKKPN